MFPFIIISPIAKNVIIELIVITMRTIKKRLMKYLKILQIFYIIGYTLFLHLNNNYLFFYLKVSFSFLVEITSNLNVFCYSIWSVTFSRKPMNKLLLNIRIYSIEKYTRICCWFRQCFSLVSEFLFGKLQILSVYSTYLLEWKLFS